MSTKALRCAVYTRKSSDEGLDQSFNSLDAQREAGEAYVRSSRHAMTMAGSRAARWSALDSRGYSAT